MGKNRVLLTGGITTFFIIIVYFLVLSQSFRFLGEGEIKFHNLIATTSRSIITATLSSTSAILFALPVAYIFSRANFPFKRALDTFLEFPLVLSPVALGTLLLIFFSHGIGKWIDDHIAKITFTLKGIIVAQFFVVYAIALRVLKSTFDSIPRRYEEVALTLGVPPWRVFRTVILPMAKHGLFASFVITWARAVGEFGASLTVAGLHPDTATLPLAIFENMENANPAGASFYILLLGGVALIMLYLVRLLSEKGERWGLF